LRDGGKLIVSCKINYAFCIGRARDTIDASGHRMQCGQQRFIGMEGQIADNPCSCFFEPP
jgi:hypothetical protein